MIKWGKMPPGGSAVSGWLFEGLINCLVWYDSELAGFKVKFRGPDGISKELPELYGDIKQAKHMAENFLQSYVKNSFVPGPGRLGLTLTGPGGEMLGQSYIDMSFAIHGDSGMIDLITTQARIMAHLWMAAERKKKNEN